MRVAQLAREQLAEITGRVPDAVTGLSRRDDKWEVTVEMVELERIPPTTNIMATYDAELDLEGHLLSYERTRRYQRGRVDDEW
jgi:hypothetical protein